MKVESYFLGLCFVLGVMWLSVKLFGWFLTAWGIVFLILSLFAAVGLAWHIVDEITEDRRD